MSKINKVKTGHQLLTFLQSLTPEQLNNEVILYNNQDKTCINHMTDVGYHETKSSAIVDPMSTIIIGCG